MWRTCACRETAAHVTAILMSRSAGGQSGVRLRLSETRRGGEERGKEAERERDRVREGELKRWVEKKYKL